MLLSVFSALGPISNATPPTAALTEFFHADTVASDHPLIQIICKLLYGTLVSATTPGQSGPQSNNNERALYTFQSFRTDPSLSVSDS